MRVRYYAISHFLVFSNPQFEQQSRISPYAKRYYAQIKFKVLFFYSMATN